MTIETSRLSLRPLSPQQLEAWGENPAGLCRALGLAYEAEPMEGHLAEVVRGQAKIAKADAENHLWHTFWLIARKEDGAVIGSADFKRPPDENGEVEIGYGLGEAFRGAGYMTETVRAMSAWALSRAGVSGVIAETEADNFASQRVLARSGFIKYKQDQTVWWRRRGMDSNAVKEFMASLGADLCGIASMDRFEGAPAGYRPTDVMPSCQSAISFACRFPVGTLYCASSAPYTRARNTVTPMMDEMALKLCMMLEKAGYPSAPVPTNESEWDAKTGRNRSIVSQKHAAQAAGLGTIGRHSLLITPELGAMVWLGCVLTEAPLAPDPLKESMCEHCELCARACPANALESEEIRQQVCWEYAFGDDPDKRDWRISCHKCRDICPHNLGLWNAALRR